MRRALLGAEEMKRLKTQTDQKGLDFLFCLEEMEDKWQFVVANTK